MYIFQYPLYDRIIKTLFRHARRISFVKRHVDREVSKVTLLMISVTDTCKNMLTIKCVGMKFLMI